MRLWVLLASATCACGNSGSTPDTDARPPGDSRPDVPVIDAAIDAPVGAWTSSPPCPDALDDIYTSQSLGTGGARGSIVKCSLGDDLTMAEAQSEMTAEGAEGVVAITGVRYIKFAYRTIRGNGTPAVSTAVAYLPHTPKALPAPMILVARPTAGIADSCAPTKDARPSRNMAMTFATRGFAVVMTDFAGLGNEGVHAYLDNKEAVEQLFDSAKALQALVPGNVIGQPVGLLGYSQGGGIALSAQGLEHATTGTRTLKGVVAMAPEWPLSAQNFSYEHILRSPDRLTWQETLTDFAGPTVLVFRHYAFFANRVGAANAGDAFPAGERSSIINTIESMCTVNVGGALSANQIRLRDLVDEPFRLAVLGCIDGTAACTGRGKEFYDWMVSDYVTPDAQGARVMIVQGLGDQVMPPAKEAACSVAKLRAAGVEPDICTDQTATHDTILERQIEGIVTWMEDVVSGSSTPTVCGSTTMPSCSP